MIAKTFEKFNYITVTISVLLLLGISIYYSTLEIKWSFFESQILNTLINLFLIFANNLFYRHSYKTNNNREIRKKCSPFNFIPSSNFVIPNRVS